MYKPQFTPGPWREKHVDRAIFAISDDSSDIVANVFDNTKDTGYANARLIAAAPELYDIIISFIESYCEFCVYEHEECTDCAILQKAQCLIERINGEVSEFQFRKPIDKTSIRFQLHPKFKTDKPRQKTLVDLWNKKGTVIYRPKEYHINGQGICFINPNGGPDSKKIYVTHDMTDRIRVIAERMVRKAVLKITKGNNYEYPLHDTGMFVGELFFDEK